MEWLKKDGKKSSQTGGGPPLYLKTGERLFAIEVYKEHDASSSEKGTKDAAPNRSSMTACIGIEALSTLPKNLQPLLNTLGFIWSSSSVPSL